MPRNEIAVRLDELLTVASRRQPWTPDDTKSGARFERVVIGDGRYVLKYQDARDDWLMRATGDTGDRYVRLWTEGLLAALPDVIDHAVVAADVCDGVGRILLRDVGPDLLPPGRRFTTEQHDRLVDHMAALHATFWGWHDEVGLTPLAARYLTFSPAVARSEAARGSGLLVPQVMAEGWERLPSVAPALAELIQPLLEDPAPLVNALGNVPHTLVHGDWKAANLGSRADGRTILLDFGEVPGEASPLADLSWYLAMNVDLLPESKDDTLARFRGALERHGVDTGSWWEAAVGLELLGTMLQFGWEKALGGPGDELSWWQSRARAGAQWL